MTSSAGARLRGFVSVRLFRKSVLQVITGAFLFGLYWRLVQEHLPLSNNLLAAAVAAFAVAFVCRETPFLKFMPVLVVLGMTCDDSQLRSNAWRSMSARAYLSRLAENDGPMTDLCDQKWQSNFLCNSTGKCACTLEGTRCASFEGDVSHRRLADESTKLVAPEIFGNAVYEMQPLEESRIAALLDTTDLNPEGPFLPGPYVAGAAFVSFYTPRTETAADLASLVTADLRRPQMTRTDCKERLITERELTTQRAGLGALLVLGFLVALLLIIDEVGWLRLVFAATSAIVVTLTKGILWG